MKLREMMNAKVHGALVTDKNLHYTGSLAMDPKILKLAGILPFEKIQVVNLANGERMWTYAIEGDSDSGQIVLNGGMAHKGEVGDRLLLITYTQLDEEALKSHRPVVVVVGADNHSLQVIDPSDPNDRPGPELSTWQTRVPSQTS
jgi:aspartate 1-decarboxylase